MTKERDRFSIATLLVLAAVAVVPMAVATGFSQFEWARHVVLAVLAAGILVSWPLGLLRRGEVKLPSPGTLLIGGLFGGVVVASLLWSSLVALGALSVILWGSLIVVFLAAALPVGRAPGFVEFAIAVGAGVIVAGALGAYDLFGGELLRVVWRPSGVTGGFDSMAGAAVYYALALPLVAGGIASSRGGARVFLGAALLLGGLHFAFVVDGWILVTMLSALGLAVGLSAAFHKEACRNVRPFGVALGLLLVASAIGIFALDRPDRESDAVDIPRLAIDTMEDLDEWAADPITRWPYFAADRRESPVDYRFHPYLRSVTRGLVAESPALGHGAAGWVQMQTHVIHDGDEVVREIHRRYPRFASPHSDYSRVLVEQGILGFVLFLLWLVSIATCGLVALRQKPEEEEEGQVGAVALFAVVVSGGALFFFTPTLELGSSAVLWAAAAGGLVAYAGRGSESRWARSVNLKTGKPVALGLAVAFGGLAALLVAPALLHASAALERGHADQLMLRTHFDRAIPHYERAHALYPSHPEGLYNVSLAYSMLAQARRGREAIHEATTLRPYDSRFRTQAVVVELASDRVDSALVHGSMAVRTGPNNARAYEAYAAALQRRARYHEASEILQMALTRGFPADYQTGLYSHLGKLHDGMLDEPEEALEFFQLALEDFPVGPERQYLLYRVNELEKRMEREELEAQGLPVPPELMPAEPHDHSHGHGHDHHHHHHH